MIPFYSLSSPILQNSLDRAVDNVYICIMTQMSKQNDLESGSGVCCAGMDELLSPRFFRALCDPNRLAILRRLARECEPCTVSRLSECCPVNISVVSRHLAILRDAGILEAEKRGKEVYYSVRFNDLVRTLRGIADAIEACCPMGRLNNREVNDEGV